MALSQNKAAILEKAENSDPSDLVTPEEAIKGPFVLECLNLKDEYSESDLEESSTSWTSSWSWAMILPSSAAIAGFVSTTPGFVLI
jgi:hypothetical protein